VRSQTEPARRAAAADAALRRALAEFRETEDERLEREAWVRTMEEALWSEPREGARGGATEE
jgi:hypothetical protein